MAITLSTLARTAAGQAIANLIDEGVENAASFIELRNGSQPNNPDQLATGEVLAVIRLSNPAFGTFVNGRSYVTPTSETDSINASGNPTWFRMYNKAGYAILDGSVSDTLGSGDLKISDTAFRMGGTIDLSSLAIEFA
jgi:hypothetical protein